MSNYLFNCNSVTVYADGDLKAYTTLPLGTYVVTVKPNEPIRLTKQNDFSVPEKLYGPVQQRTEHIFKTFEERKASTGVLFIGVKGSGKTMQARHLSKYLAEKGYPTIIVPFGLICQQVADFIEMIDTPSLVLFDEVDKVSAAEDHNDETFDANAEDRTNSLLSLFDGLSNTKKLFVLTANSVWKVNQHVLNRPGRIYYRFDFDGIGEEAIRQYCKESLDNQQYVEDILTLSSMVEDFSFDILKAVCEECNRFSCNPRDTLDYLNIRPSLDRYYSYEVKSKNGEVCRNPVDDDSLQHLRIADRFSTTTFRFYDDYVGNLVMNDWTDHEKERYNNASPRDKQSMRDRASYVTAEVHDSAFSSVKGGIVTYNVTIGSFEYTIRCTPVDIRYKDSWRSMQDF